MKILKVKEKLQSQKIFSLQDIYTVFPDFRRETLYDWESQGYMKKIRNKYYTFSDQEFRDSDLYIISNKIYDPSYISLESALNHYGVIPEAVLKVIAVTTRKTNSFETDFGTFTYKSIKKSLFWGYKIIQSENIGIKIAEPEKAILDYLYLNPSTTSDGDFESLRLNTDILEDILDHDKFEKYLKIFSNDKLYERASQLISYVKGNA
jgi:predicted transcriptional regulator of viral defense system